MRNIAFILVLIISTSAFAAPSPGNSIKVIPAGAVIVFNSDLIIPANTDMAWLGTSGKCSWRYKTATHERALRTGKQVVVTQTVDLVADVKNGFFDSILINTDKGLNIACDIGTTVGQLQAALKEDKAEMRFPQPSDF